MRKEFRKLVRSIERIVIVIVKNCKWSQPEAAWGKKREEQRTRETTL